MSVLTAIILGSLLCGLLLVIAAGCGLRLYRLYHMRVSLEHRWTTIRQQQRTIKWVWVQNSHAGNAALVFAAVPNFLFLICSNEFDEFGRRRPVMGRQPPPSYAQAMGNAALMPSNVPITSIPVHSGNQPHRIRYCTRFLFERLAIVWRKSFILFVIDGTRDGRDARHLYHRLTASCRGNSKRLNRLRLLKLRCQSIMLQKYCHLWRTE